MTYCVALQLNHGLLFMSDTRTNAGVDNFATAKKMHTWEVPGERFITLMTAGNLATTQSVISLLDERTKPTADRMPSILEAPSMFQVARIVGNTLKEVIQSNSQSGASADSSFGATILVGGQIMDGPPCLFMVYPEGNFIEASAETPFFQIGEVKYGKPILIRAYDENMDFNEAIKLLLVSFDSTLKSNLSVGLPLDYQCYVRESLTRGKHGRIKEDDPYYKIISNNWGDSLREAFQKLPPFTG